MKVESYIFLGIAAFIAVATGIYWWFSREVTGTTALILSGGLALIIGSYLLFQARRLPMLRPEDRGEADIHEGAGDIGFFAPHSLWPVLCAAGAAVTFLGLIFGLFLILLGLIFLAIAVPGLLYEFYLGRGALMKAGGPDHTFH